jgi:hypothetical protein
MDCQKCQELLSDYLDGELASQDYSQVNMHLSECADCLAVHDDLNTIVGACEEQREQFYSVPNERALWLRISNVIESEEQAQKAAASSAVTAKAQRSGFSGLLNRRWEFSLPQMVSTVAAIIIAVALGTAVGLRFTSRSNGDFTAQKSGPVITNVAAPTKGNNAGHDERFDAQTVSIEYWNQRVQERKPRWNPQMRDAFDRNMDVIDLTVKDAMNGLQQNPHDDVSEQMLSEALKDKMELLKEFSEY